MRQVFRDDPIVKLQTASTANEALRLLADTRFDLILLDINLPDLSGSEVLMMLTMDPKTSSIPVVVTSADASRSQIDKMLSLGAKEYLTKPLDISDLVEAVYEWSDEPRERH